MDLLNPEQKLEAIKKSDAIKVIVDISETANASFTSSRQTRNGNMAFVVKFSNLLKNQLENEAFASVEGLD